LTVSRPDAQRWLRPHPKGIVAAGQRCPWPRGGPRAPPASLRDAPALLRPISRAGRRKSDVVDQRWLRPHPKGIVAAGQRCPWPRGGPRAPPASLRDAPALLRPISRAGRRKSDVGDQRWLRPHPKGIVAAGQRCPWPRGGPRAPPASRRDAPALLRPISRAG